MNLEQNPQKKILIITAHPDDDTMVGGTLAKLASAGYAVNEFVCTSGKNGKPNPGEPQDSRTMAENRRKEIDVFSRGIGAEPALIYENQKEFLELDEPIILALVKYMRTIRPDVILLLNDQDYHFEHRLSYDIGLRAAEIAFRSANLELGPKLTAGIILKTDGLNVLANPLIHFDTSDTHSVAAEACKAAYDERLGDLSRFSDGLSGMRGARIGVMNAEAFELMNPPWYKLTQASAEILAAFVAAGTQKPKKP